MFRLLPKFPLQVINRLLKSVDDALFSASFGSEARNLLLAIH